MKQGTSRRVFFINKYAIKIANTYNMKTFLHGCYCNWAERQFCINFAKHPYIDLVVPSLFCSWFGIIQIQQKGVLVDKEIDYNLYINICQDLKKENFVNINGKIVCCDYIN